MSTTSPAPGGQGERTAAVPAQTASPAASPSETGLEPLEPRLTGLAHRTAHVNLLPPEILQARALLRAQRLLAAATAVVLLGLGGAWWHATAQVDAATGALAAEQARTATLTAARAEYAEVTTVQAEVTRVQAAQSQVMADDVLWRPLLDAIDSTAPEDVWLTDLSVSLAASGSVDAADTSADPLAKPSIASISVSGFGVDHEEVAAWLDAVTAVEGLSDARFTSSVTTEVGGHSVVSFTSSVGVTADALSHRFEQGSD